MNKAKSSHFHNKTEEILKGMLEMFRESDSEGVSIDTFIAYLRDKKKKSHESDTEWSPKKPSMERAVYRYIGQLRALGCKIACNVDNGHYVLCDKDWQFPEKTPWSLSSSAIQKVGELLLPMLEDIILPQDILARIDEGIHISIKDNSDEEIQKTVICAWAERKELLIYEKKGKGEKSHNIEPHGLVFRNDEWQIVAKEGDKAKIFSLSKIVKAKLVSSVFVFDSNVLKKALGANQENEEEMD